MKEKKRGPEFDYKEIYEETLEWVRQDPHIMNSRQKSEQPQLHEAICKVAAAIITLINSQAENPIPQGNWKAYRGTHTTRPRELGRGAFTVSVGEISKLTGLSGMPKATETTPEGMNTLHRFITVLWQRARNPGESEYVDDFTLDKIGPANLVTAFPSIGIDQVVNTKAQHDYRWSEFGKASERQNLIDSFLKKMGS